MSFAKMKAYLHEAYDRHWQEVFMQETLRSATVIGERPEVKRKVPILSRPLGVGKTACVKELAVEIGFELVVLDCSFIPASQFAATLNTACIGIRQATQRGCVILIEHFNEVDAEWQEVLRQYMAGHLDSNIMVADENKPGKKRSLPLRQSWIPEGVFIIGEKNVG